MVAWDKSLDRYIPYIRKNLARGVTQHQIGLALGLSQKSIGSLARRHGMVRPLKGGRRKDDPPPPPLPVPPELQVRTP